MQGHATGTKTKKNRFKFKVQGSKFQLRLEDAISITPYIRSEAKDVRGG